LKTYEYIVAQSECEMPWDRGTALPMDEARFVKRFKESPTREMLEVEV
jgi:hypothetical protein